MKRLFIFFGVLGSLATNAQTLIQAVHQPEIGNIEKVRQLDTSGFSSGLPNSTIGANSVWDFSSALPLNSSTLNNNYVSPTTFTHGALFPSATIVQDLPGNMFTYFGFVTTPTVQTEIVGIYRPDIVISFSNTGVVIQYPASLGFSVVDDMAGTFSVGTISGQVTGETQTIADGTGTVILGPGVVFNDVIRVKCVQTLTLTQGTLTGHLNQTVYNYYTSSQKFPVVNISYISMSLGTGTPSVTAGMFANADNYAPVGLNEPGVPAHMVQVYPNPASQLININAGTAIHRTTVYSMAGATILTNERSGAVDISALPNGIYFMKVESESGITSRKIVVAH